MHFLSHYYTELPIHNKDGTASLFVGGLVLPDLVPGFSRIYNKVISKQPQPPTAAAGALYAGVSHHYSGDKKFHNSPAFLQHMGLCTQSFVQQGLSRVRLRLSVLSHLAIEMLVDRQIVIAHRDVCNDFYQHLDNIGEDALISFFKHYSLHGELTIFFQRLEFFRQRKFLYLFTDLEKIVLGLNRVYNSVTETEFTEEENAQFLASLRNMDEIIRYRWQEILNV